MHPIKLLTFIGFGLLLTACGNNASSKSSNFLIQINSETNVISNANTLRIELINPKNYKIDSVQLTLDNSKIETSVALASMTLGEKIIKAKVYYDSKFEIALKK